MDRQIDSLMDRWMDGGMDFQIFEIPLKNAAKYFPNIKCNINKNKIKLKSGVLRIKKPNT